MQVWHTVCRAFSSCLIDDIDSFRIYTAAFEFENEGGGPCGPCLGTRFEALTSAGQGCKSGSNSAE